MRSIKEDNTLIYLFMAEFQEHESDKLNIINDLMVKGCDPSKYYESWDLLMPVIQKIGNDFHQIKIEVNEGFPYCEILCYLNNELSSEIREEHDKLIDCAYHAVIAFINWYNENK